MNRMAIVLILGGVGATGGCALAPLAALGVVGNVSDIGSTAFSAGTEVFTAGRLESVEFCTRQQGEVAVRWMLNDLRLRASRVESDKQAARFDVVDSIGGKTEIGLISRTPAMCQFQVNVGWFGSEAYARLLLKSIRGRLPAVVGHPTTLPSEPMDLARVKYPKGFMTDEPGH